MIRLHVDCHSFPIFLHNIFVMKLIHVQHFYRDSKHPPILFVTTLCFLYKLYDVIAKICIVHVIAKICICIDCTQSHSVGNTRTPIISTAYISSAEAQQTTLKTHVGQGTTCMNTQSQGRIDGLV